MLTLLSTLISFLAGGLEQKVALEKEYFAKKSLLIDFQILMIYLLVDLLLF